MQRNVFSIVLAGGQGSRLSPLTDDRAKPAVPFGGPYRLIDFALSNLVNGGLRRIAVLTQYKSHSLDRHISVTWRMSPLTGSYVTPVPAQMRRGPHWFSGSADAIFQNLNLIKDENPDHVIVFGADHIYRVDPSAVLAFHKESGAGVTVMGIRVPIAEASAFGVIETSDDDPTRIADFVEKPDAPKHIPGDPDHGLASMGNYVFERDFLYEQLARDHADAHSSHDFGTDIIPSIVADHPVYAFPFRDPKTGGRAYWRDVGTLDAFWEAHMDLVSITPELDLYDRDWPILTHQAQLPPAKFIFDDADRRGMAVDSMVSGGCLVSGSVLRRTLLFSNVTVRSYSTIEDSVVLPDVTVGRHCRIRHAIIDRGAEIPPRTRIGLNPEEDRERGFRVTERGVVLVTPEMLGQKLHVGG